MVRYELPGLPYGYGDLAPHAGAAALELHHRGHHGAHADGLNSALAAIGAQNHPGHISSILSDLASVPEHGRAAVAYHGGGYDNHAEYWESMAPGGGGAPGGRLGDAIDVYFGGFAGFRRRFEAAAASVEGSGWCWLAFNPVYNRPEILVTPDNCSPRSLRMTPLLALDLWEHAYYPDHLDGRDGYVRSWWGVANWDRADGRYSGLAG